ncbi:MAG: hypothetical protein LIP10_03395 [Clostridiales bacterium]|nr:hypothetical protein [Clostridiales bacterium]
MSSKLKSRKFWMSVAAFLASIATSIAGITIENQAITIVGVICSVVSTAIYAGCEAYVDGKSVSYTIETEETYDYTDEEEE